MKTNFFKKALSGVLSAACVFSGTAFAGMTALTAETPVEVQAASSSDSPVFSWDNATVYFLLTDRFNNGDPSNDNAYGRMKTVAGDNRATFHGGDFKGITDKINEGYFNDLGVNAIWLTAPYEQLNGYILGDGFAHYSYHGYYVTDYTETDDAYGTKQEFQTLVDTAHEHGIRIVMDIVMNHAGYNNMIDMYEYNYGTLLDGWKATYDSGDLQNYHKKIDYESSAADWGRWWGSDWVRSGLPGYNTQGSGPSEQIESLTGLPDFRTESTNQVSIPQFLQTKWQKEGTLSAKMAKYGTSNTVTGYISTWLAEWVETYGVDGFRCDTAKHVDKGSWKQLKDKCVTALKKWKANNPSKKLDDLDFWMTGEAWGWNLSSPSDPYFTEGGFDSMINFQTQGGGMVAQGVVAGTYQDYADRINSSDNFNGLSYLSSHDSVLARPSDMYALGSAFLMLPGAVQIYYGDETARPQVGQFDGGGGAGHSLRSDMPWSSLNTDLIKHWGIVGRFRNNHISVGAGSNVGLTASSGVAFGRTYDKNGISDKVAGVIYASPNTDVSVDVSALWGNGTQLHNFYDDTYATVSGGKVTFNSGAHGTILIEEPSGPRGVVKVTHIDKDKGTTIKEETLSGGIGESYTTSPLSLEGYTVASTSGKTSGTFTEAQIDVTYYYTFDSNNYGFIVTKHVDAASGAEIAESVTETKKVGTTYTTSAATIKDYELDTVPANATGTVVKGTTTVTYKYNYVEPTTLRVHYYNSNSWSPVYMYSYDERSGTAKEFNGKWPGAQMTAESDGWYVCDADTEWALVIFNAGSGGPQEPSGGTLAKGYESEGEVWIKDAKVYPTGKVNVKYVSTDGKTLAAETLKGMADGTNSYTTSAKTFDGYTLTETPSNASGKYTEGTTTVVYTYKSNVAEVLPTGVTLSSSTLSVAVGKTATLTATVSPSNATNKTVTWTSSDSSVATVTDGTVKGVKAGTATITVKTTNGKTATCKVTVTDSSVSTLKNTSTVSTDVANINETVTITGKASGGTTPYKFAYYYKKSGASSWTTIKDYSTSTTATFTPTAEADYSVKIVVKDNTGATATQTLTVECMDLGTPLANNSTISATLVNIGTSVKMTGKASGGTSPYTYAFYYKAPNASAFTLIGTAYTTTTGSFTLNKEGVYTAKVIAKDSAGTTVSKIFSVEAMDLGTDSLTNNSSVSSTNVTAGTKVTITGKASGGTTPYKYAYYYKRSTNTKWNVLGTEFGTATSAYFTPTAAADYDVKVDVKDNAGTVVSKQFTVKVSGDTSALTNKSTIIATKAQIGDDVRVTGAAAGGSGSYTYAFYFKRSANSKWNKIGTEFGTKTYAVMIPTAAADYDMKVIVKDSKGATAEKKFTVTVVKSMAVTNVSVINTDTTVPVNKTVTISGRAVGGTKPISYAFYFKRSVNSTWNKLSYGSSSGTYAKFTPTTATSYDLKVVAVDANGVTSNKTITITAK